MLESIDKLLDMLDILGWQFSLADHGCRRRFAHRIPAMEVIRYPTLGWEGSHLTFRSRPRV